MLRVEECALVLLAAGRSARFGGSGRKLDQPLLGLPLGLHAAVALEGIGFGARIAVVGGSDLDYAAHGFVVVENLDADRGIASSIALGVDRAAALGAQSALIVLADMPRIAARHVTALFAASSDAGSVVASSDGSVAGPPALFGAGRFAELLALDGDRGARALVRGGRHVITTPADLVDIDTVDDLDRLRALLHDPGVERS